MITRISWLLAVVAIAFSWVASASSESRNPLNTVSIVTNPVIHTSNKRLHAYSEFMLSFTVFNHQNIRLRLEPNHDVLPPGASVQYLDKDGKISHSEPIDRLEHKVFLGDVSAQNVDGSYHKVGHARILIHEDGEHPFFEGSFDIRRDYYHIQLSSHYKQTKHLDDPESQHISGEHMVVYRDSDLKDEVRLHSEFKKRKFAADEHVSATCMSDDLEFNIDPEHPIYAGMPQQHNMMDSWSVPASHLFRRQIDTSPGSGNSAGVNLASTIGNPTGCPTTRRVALVGVATDCGYTNAFANTTDSSKTNAYVKANVISIMNQASGIYESTFNITLGLQNLTISLAECPGSPPPATPWNQACSASNVQIQDRLNLFSSWRAQQKDSNSHWTLLSTCPTGTAVGLAWLGQACVINADPRNSTSGVQTVAGANFVVRTTGSQEWQILAHETGHTFGAVHDCVQSTCNDGSVTKQLCCPLSTSTCDAGSKYIMNPSTANGITNFSPCSLGNICSAFGRQSVKSSCFSQNKGVPLLTSAVCGNGIVEQGEDCDCGGSNLCSNDGCCDPNTCKFKNGAVCDPTNDECCRNCQFAPVGTVCRTSTGVCDPQEVCSGTNATCPPDSTSPNGADCGNGLQCASGQCTSRDQQCQNLMGPYLNGNNNTSACDDSNCQLSCASSQFGPNTCYGLQQNFLDGTPCGGGGQCQNGVCKGSDLGKEIGNWISQHKTIVIVVCVVIGTFLLLAIGSCIFRAVVGYRRRRIAPAPAGNWPRRKYPNQSNSGMMNQQWQPQPVNYAIPPPPPMAQQSGNWRYG